MGETITVEHLYRAALERISSLESLAEMRRLSHARLIDGCKELARAIDDSEPETADHAQVTMDLAGREVIRLRARVNALGLALDQSARITHSTYHGVFGKFEKCGHSACVAAREALAEGESPEGN